MLATPGRREHIPSGLTAPFPARPSTIVQLGDSVTGKELQPPGEGQEPTDQFAFAPDGKTVVTVSAARTAVLWDVATGRELRRAERPGYTCFTAFLPGGKVLVDFENSRITLRDAVDDAKLRESGPTPVQLSGQHLIASPDGGTVMTLTDGSRTFDLWDTATARHQGFPGPVTAAAPFEATRIVSADGHTFAVYGVGAESKLLLWDADTGEQIGQLDAFVGIPQSLALSTGGRLLLERPFNRRVAHVWDLAKRQLLWDLDVDQDRLAAMALSPGGSIVAAGGYNNGVVRR